MKHSTVHPHTRGEHQGMAEAMVGGVGSSPHTWGTPHSWSP